MVKCMDRLMPLMLVLLHLLVSLHMMLLVSLHMLLVLLHMLLVLLRMLMLLVLHYHYRRMSQMMYRSYCRRRRMEVHMWRQEGQMNRDRHRS